MDLLRATSAERKPENRIEDNGGVAETAVTREESLSREKEAEEKRKGRKKEGNKKGGYGKIGAPFPATHERKMLDCRERKRALGLAEYRDRRNRVLVDGDAARPLLRGASKRAEIEGIGSSVNRRKMKDADGGSP